MSLKMIEASRSPVYRRMGCSVISVANGGERQTSKNSCDSRTFRNSSYTVVCQVTFHSNPCIGCYQEDIDQLVA